MIMHKTTRGALLARMEHSREPDGAWLVEGFRVFQRGARWWEISIDEYGVGEYSCDVDVSSFTEALEFIADRIELGEE